MRLMEVWYSLPRLSPVLELRIELLDAGPDARPRGGLGHVFDSHVALDEELFPPAGPPQPVIGAKLVLVLIGAHAFDGRPQGRLRLGQQLQGPLHRLAIGRGIAKDVPDERHAVGSRVEAPGQIVHQGEIRR